MKRRNNIIAASVAILMLAVLLLLGLSVNKFKFYSPNVVVFGDSLIGNDRTEESVTEILASISGKEVFNAGIGGSLMTKGNPENNIMAYYNMVNMSEFIMKGNCDILVSLAPKAYLTQYDVISYVKDTLKTLKHVNFKNVEVVVIEQGTNDMLGGISADDYSIALNKSIENLKKINPDLKIIVISPGYISERDNENIVPVGEYIEAGKNVSEKQNAVFVDFYHQSGINETNYEEFLYDGLHTNAKGNRILAELIYDAMKD